MNDTDAFPLTSEASVLVDWNDQYDSDTGRGHLCVYSMNGLSATCSPPESTDAAVSTGAQDDTFTGGPSILRFSVPSFTEFGYAYLLLTLPTSGDEDELIVLRGYRYCLGSEINCLEQNNESPEM